MNYKKGQAVQVKDCDGRNVPLRVWKDEGGKNAVFVASDQVFQLLEAGKTDVWALMFPRAAVRTRRA
jgi:hypothetical protein